MHACMPCCSSAACLECCPAFQPSPRPGHNLLLSLRRPQLGRAVPEFLAAANDEVTVMVQIETKQSLDELEVR